MRNPMGVVAAAMVLVTATGCAKRSAESAVASAEKAVAAIQADAAKIAPGELKAITDSITGMKARIASGDYRAALMGARSATSMARDLGSGLAKRKDQLTTSFNALSTDLPKAIAAVSAKVTELGALRRLPAGLDAAKLAALKADVSGWEAAWSAASQAFQGGNLAEALNQGRDIAAKVAAAQAFLGLK